MDYVFNTILAIVGAFIILSVALLVWIINLLARVSELERELKKAKFCGSGLASQGSGSSNGQVRETGSRSGPKFTFDLANAW